jgi:short subunit dehydrogenase-like uncharacterized protein
MKMGSGNWLIYGTNGYTGELIAEAAVQRNHRPVLAGRSAHKQAPIAERLDLDMVVFDLQHEIQLEGELRDFDLVLNAAGPFIHTAVPFVHACLETGTNYLDISGEVKVLEEIFTLNHQAHQKEIAIIPGVGFNVLASDCLSRYVAEQIENPTHLEIATRWIIDQISPGSTKTMIESYPMGILGRRRGKLVPINVRNLRRRQPFMDGEYPILPVAFGDLTTAYKTTHIPNITTYTALDEPAANLYSLTEPVLRRLYGIKFIRGIAEKWVEKVTSKEEHGLRQRKASQVWAMARNAEKHETQAWMKTIDSYSFTAKAAVRSVEKLFSDRIVGVLTPAQAFGANFVLEIPGIRRVDRLEDV